jgi:chaperonin GroES|tara:strand:- start:2586 stop:2864 length:279 start_codon:yes stop_codon:yes gene_type:complete
MSMTVIPVGRKLLLKKWKVETKTAGGLYIPEIARKTEYKGTVVGKGKDVHEIDVGDIVQYAEHAMPTPMMHQNEEHLLVQEGDVFAIVRMDE